MIVSNGLQNLIEIEDYLFKQNQHYKRAVVLEAHNLLQEMADVIQFDAECEDSTEGYKRLQEVLNKFKKWR